jgi:hypothetical protein
LQRGRIERDTCLADCLQPPARVGLEAAPHQVAHAFRRPRGKRAPVRFSRQHGGDRVGDGLAAEYLRPGQHLEEDDPERPDVGPSINRFAARLLRCHVGGSAQNQAGLGDRASEGERIGVRTMRGTRRGMFKGLRQAEVQYLHRAVTAPIATSKSRMGPARHGYTGPGLSLFLSPLLGLSSAVAHQCAPRIDSGTESSHPRACPDEAALAAKSEVQPEEPILSTTYERSVCHTRFGVPLFVPPRRTIARRCFIDR